MGFQAFSGENVREGRPRRHPRWSPEPRIAEKTLRGAGGACTPCEGGTGTGQPNRPCPTGF